MTELISFRVFDFAAEVRGRHLVGLVADDQIPSAVRREKLALDVLIAGEFVQASNDVVGLQEPVTGSGSLQLVVGQNLKWQVETAIKFILPLLRQTAGADDEATLKVTAGDELLNKKTGHDRFAGAGVVGKQESQRLAREHGVVNCRDLMRQGFNQRSMHS